jgi:hypothetical protein
MHNSHIAEWILALVTSRDRATTTVGDLMERGTARSGVWFWSSILRTAGAFLWWGVTENKARVARLALLGLAVYIGMGMLHAGLSGIAFFLAAMASGHSPHLDSIGWGIWFAARLVVSSLLIGRMLARWAPGRELAACAAFAVIISIYDVSLLGNNGGGSALLSTLLASAAAVWGRRRKHLAQ